MKECFFMRNLISLCARLGIKGKSAIVCKVKYVENRGFNPANDKSFESKRNYTTQITLHELLHILKVTREWGLFSVVTGNDAFIVKADTCFVMGTGEAPGGAIITGIEDGLQLQDLLRRRDGIQIDENPDIYVPFNGTLPTFMVKGEEIKCPYPNAEIAQFGRRFIDDVRTVLPISRRATGLIWLTKWTFNNLNLDTEWSIPDASGWQTYLSCRRIIKGDKLIYKYYKKIQTQLIPFNSNVPHSQKKGLLINAVLSIINNTHCSQYAHAIFHLKRLKIHFKFYGYTDQWINRTLKDYVYRETKQAAFLIDRDAERHVTIAMDHVKDFNTRKAKMDIEASTQFSSQFCNRAFLKTKDLINGLIKSQDKRRSNLTRNTVHVDESIKDRKATITHKRKLLEANSELNKHNRLNMPSAFNKKRRQRTNKEPSK